MTEHFDEEYWEGRYRAHGGHRHLRPNAQLIAEVADLPPGTALDAGCGEGADAVWLAERGWRVTAVDIAVTALARARERAEAAGVTGVDWRQADLTSWRPAEGSFDLVCAHYVHPSGSRDDLVGALAAAVAPGGTLLVVGHDPADHHAVPEAHSTADEVLACLDPDRWEVVTAEARSRTTVDPHGREIAMRDTVVRARRRA